jgi:hypothetical protein
MWLRAASERAELAGEGQVLRVVQLLIPEEQHLVLQQGGPEFGLDRRFQRRSEIEAGDLGAAVTADLGYPQWRPRRRRRISLAR